MTIPASSAVVRSQSSSPAQYAVPTRKTGKCRILPVWMRVSASKNSSSVPNPPGMITNAVEYFTSITLRAKKWSNWISLSR